VREWNISSDGFEGAAFAPSNDDDVVEGGKLDVDPSEGVDVG
jgi:hypothetical protein